METIQFNIFSYTSSLHEINEYRRHTKSYLKNIEKNRETKQFVYKLIKTPPSNDDDYIYMIHGWRQHLKLLEILTTFVNKDKVLNKITSF